MRYHPLSMNNHQPRSIAIAEIAGRDSVAAAVAAVRARGFSQLLPTIALTGTETGDAGAPLRAIELLTTLLGETCEVLEPIHLQESALWSALNARFAAAVSERYRMYSSCLACHLYLHLLRAPVSWAHGNAPIIAGERETHDGRVKLSQTPESIDAAVRVLAHGGIELLQPIRHASGAQVAALVGGGWEEGGAQLGCLLSGNYTRLDGSVTYNQTRYARYIEEFFEPAGRAITDAWRAQRDDGPAVQWNRVVRDVLVASEPRR